jgi:serine protease Do
MKLIVAVFALAVATHAAPPKRPVPDANTIPLRMLSDAFVSVAEHVKPAVVSVHPSKVTKLRHPELPFGDDFFRYFFDQNQPRRRGQTPPREYQFRQNGLGSGIIIDKEGRILTNNHVVQDVDEIKVTLNDRRVFDAEVVGTDPKTDLAVIKIKGRVPADLPVADLGDSDVMRVGDWVLAIGAPFGYEQTVTAGIISAKGRGNVGAVDYEDFLQTDAAINPGNSGGPLVNLRGEVIGINSVIATGGAQQSGGVGFAIPINMAKNILPTLVKGGKVSRGMLGVVIQNVDNDLRDHFKLPNTEGALVTQVNKDSPAEKAGIQPQDVIIKFNGQPVQDVRHLRNLVAANPPNSKAEVVVLRDGKPKEFRLQLGELTGDVAGGPGEPTATSELGLKVEPLTPELAKQFGYDKDSGVIVSEVDDDSPAGKAELRAGDLITEVNRDKVTNLKEFRAAVAKAKDAASVLLVIKRDGASRFVILKLK